MTQNPELMTFNQATLVAPLFLISVLFLPTLFYVLVQSIKFYGWGWANWITSFLDDPVLFLFPILTSMSFYEYDTADNITINEPKEEENIPEVPAEAQEKNEDTEDNNEVDLRTGGVYIGDEIIIEDLEAEDNDYEIIEVVEVEENPENLQLENVANIQHCGDNEDAIEKRDKEELKGQKIIFSRSQSNILYLLFALGASVCIGVDISIQVYRSSHLTSIMNYILPVCLGNLLLWVDFMLTANSINLYESCAGIIQILNTQLNFSGYYASVFSEILAYTTNTFVCFKYIVMLPVLGCQFTLR